MYQLITDFRNYLFDIGYKRSIQFDLPVINVGNLRIGGTGKTPMVAHIVRILQAHYAVGIVSRGYGRKTKGFLLANETTTAAQIGDEPMLLWQQFKHQLVRVAVGEERSIAIPSLLLEHPEIQAIVLDDAFQHRYVQPSLNILLTTYAKPFYKDYVLPFGRLRESPKGAKRADVVIVTKCPDTLSLQERTAMEQHIQGYTKPHTPIFFTKISYQQPLPVFENQTATLQQQDKIILFSGLADDSLWQQFAQQHYKVMHVKSFADHYRYQPSDLQTLIALSQQHQAALLTTEKDMVKLKTLPDLAQLCQDKPIFYVPIGIDFLAQQAQFEAMLLAHVAQRLALRHDNN